MLCQIGSDDSDDPSIGPNVVCQGSFPQAPLVDQCGGVGRQCSPPMHLDQAVVTATGQFKYRDANIGVGDNPTLDTLVPGQTYNIHGWTVSATDAGITFTNNGHGMTIAGNGDVDSF